VGLTSSYTVSLKKMNASWGEGPSTAYGGGGAPSADGDVTWLHRFYPNTLWSTAGGQFSSTTSASRSVGGQGYYTWTTTAQLVADVQGWLDNSATNFGWLVQGKLRPHVSRVVGLAEVPQVLEDLLQRRVVGKVVVRP
jgi:NADPH:quinone reductase-like Zn-dependent oxidoreductase